VQKIQGPGVSPRLTVLFDVRQRHGHQNPYVMQLVEALSGEHSVLWFTWRNALFGSYDVLQLNWPEHLVRHRRVMVSLAGAVAVALLVLRLRAWHVPVVLTVHNRRPHDALTPVQRVLLTQLRRCVRHVVFMNADEASSTLPYSVIPHGHYVDWYRHNQVPPARRSTDVVLVGLLKPYKGCELLIRAFADSGLDGRLVIAGQPSDRRYARALAGLARGTPDVVVLPRRLSDDELAGLVGSAVLTVLPYHDFYNSGALLTSLSLGTPALVPGNRITALWRAEVGSEWIRLFDGTLTGDELADAVDWARASGGAGRPDLSTRDWARVARSYQDVYRSLTQPCAAASGVPEPTGADGA
jgi:beta-1,4-mannosyltransferase